MGLLQSGETDTSDCSEMFLDCAAKLLLRAARDADVQWDSMSNHFTVGLGKYSQWASVHLRCQAAISHDDRGKSDPRETILDSS